MKKYNIAVVGATGNVGREILNILDSRNFPYKNIFAIASPKSEGQKITYGNDKEIISQNKQNFTKQFVSKNLEVPDNKILFVFKIW